MNTTEASYHIGLKILLSRGSTSLTTGDRELLFLTAAPNGRIDLPGGRIDESEHYILLEEILKREVREELGSAVKYTLGKPLFQFRRHFEDKGFRIFITVYGAEFLSGDIQLSSEHAKYEWVNLEDLTFEEKDFFHREEFLAFKRYFEKVQNL